MDGEIRSEFKIERIKLEIIDLLLNYENGCTDKETSILEKWVSSKEFIKDLEEHKIKKQTEKELDLIVKDIQKKMSLDALMSSETIHNSEQNTDNEQLLHADEFLYDDDDFNEHFSDKNKYCEDCGSNKVNHKEIISHSMSRTKLQHMFNVMLPSDCSNMRILDVGSRIGAVLYGAYFYSNSQQIYGIEINKELYDIQEDIVKRYKLDDRIKLIHDDILNQGEIIETFDIVVLNNVFEFFLNKEQQINIWRFLKKKLKSGCLVITIPSIEVSLDKLNIYEEFFEWLKRTPVHQEKNSYLYDETVEVNFHDMYLYTVK